MLGAKKSYYCTRKASLLCRSCLAGDQAPRRGTGKGVGVGVKKWPKTLSAKDCGGGVKGRRPVSFSIPQFDCLFLRAPSQYSPFFWDKEPGSWGGVGGYFLK